MRRISVNISDIIEFEIRRRRAIAWVVGVCVAITLALVALDWAVTYRRATDIGAIRRLFNMAREDSLASWYAVTVTCLAALTGWLIWAAARRVSQRGRTVGWLVVALFLTWMTVDDGAAVHERLGTAFELTREEGTAGGGSLTRLAESFPSYGWQLLLMPQFVLVGVFTLAFLWRTSSGPLVRGLALAALGCLAIAVGIDFMEGLDPEHPANLQAWLARRPWLARLSAPDYKTPLESVVHFGKVIEEAIEIIGMTLLWAVLLDQLILTASRVRIRVAG